MTTTSTNYQLDTEQTRAFWAANQADYFGAKNGAMLLFLVDDVLGKNILDAGAGDGSLMRMIKASNPGIGVRGIDLAPKDESVETGDLTALPYEDASFDNAFCSEVVEHVSPEDTVKILNEIFRVLQPGTHLVLTVPYNERLEDALVACPDCNRVFHRYGHQQTFLESDIEKLAEKTGFEPVHILPVKMSRAKRYKFLGRGLLRSDWMAGRMRKMNGKRTLMSVLRKPAS